MPAVILLCISITATLALCALCLQENHELRTSSIVLFGNLTKFSTGNCEDVFFEQILNGLVTLLLHLQDPKPEVIKVSALLLDWGQQAFGWCLNAQLPCWPAGSARTVFC